MKSTGPLKTESLNYNREGIQVQNQKTVVHFKQNCGGTIKESYFVLPGINKIFKKFIASCNTYNYAKLTSTNRITHTTSSM